MRFSGHESFQCRYYWLKKGYDYIQTSGNFSSDDAPVKLGVGKNMVTSIRFWLKAFDVYGEHNSLSEFAAKIFDDKSGWDPYLEDQGTLWLLHYHLIKNQFASTYHLIFNELRKRRPEFNLSHFEGWVNESGGSVSSNTLKADLQIFSRTYIPRDDSKDLDESYSGLLTELGLVNKLKREKLEWFSIEPKGRPEIPAAIFMYCILENRAYGNSISFDVMYNEGVGSIFALNREGLIEKLEEISERYNWATFSNEAGVKELQFSSKPDSLAILKEYYED
ncbi:MAG: DUF4007 family protein [Cyclobacteriaceae bacterium]